MAVMTPEIVRCSAELSAAHHRIQQSLGSAWDAAICLLREPDDVERYLQCSRVAEFLRVAQVHILVENDVVLASAERAGVPARDLAQLRDEHSALCAALASVRPLLARPDTVERAAVSVLRLVSRFEHHLTHEESLIASASAR